MKVLLHLPHHHKNINGINLMCKSVGWECEFTNSDERLKTSDYDIVILNQRFIEPSLLPPNVKIIYGPQHWVIPRGPIIGAIDEKYREKACFNALSPWVSTYYLELCGSLRVDCCHFPYAVDVDRFCPVDQSKTIDCILYVKRRSKETVKKVHDFLLSKDLVVKKYEYGSYNETEYLKDLHLSKFMMVVDAHESQGFAIQEAMSCNVPLLVLDATSMYDEMNGNDKPTYSYLQPKKLLATSLPYWSDNCGIKITDVNELPEIFDKFIKNLKEYSPREYVLETLSPKVCMERILKHFELL